MYILLYGLAKTKALSHGREIGDIGFGHKGISNDKVLSHSTSLQAAAKATNSDAIVELAIHVCFFIPQNTTPTPRVKIHPLVEELSSLFVQHAYEKSSRTDG